MLVGLPDLRSQLTYYVERYQPHLLAVYDIAFLQRMIEERLASPVDARVAMEAHRS